jgi:hypothetical protein
MDNNNKYGFFYLISKIVSLTYLSQSINKLENNNLRWFRVQYRHVIFNAFDNTFPFVTSPCGISDGFSAQNISKVLY